MTPMASDTAVCEHEWATADWHVCPSIARDDNRHAHYQWSVCRKCGEGSILNG